MKLLTTSSPNAYHSSLSIASSTVQEYMELIADSSDFATEYSKIQKYRFHSWKENQIEYLGHENSKILISLCIWER